jgi:hypothetical protein
MLRNEVEARNKLGTRSCLNDVDNVKVHLHVRFGSAFGQGCIKTTLAFCVFQPWLLSGVTWDRIHKSQRFIFLIAYESTK